MIDKKDYFFRTRGFSFFGAILPIDACLLPLPLSPPPPPPNIATMITSILPRDVFFLRTPIVSFAITRTKTRNSTQRVLPLRFQFDFPEPAVHLTSLFSVDLSRVLEHEFETPRSKSDATQLTFDDPEWAPITSPFSVDSPSALDLKLKKRATASNSVEVLFTVRESTKVKEKGSRSNASQLASDDLDWAPLTSPFSVDSPLTLDLKVRASVSKLVDGFLSSYHSKKVDSKYSSLVTRVRRPRLGTNNQSLQCGFAPYSGSRTRSAQEQNFEDFLSVGKETTPSVLPVPFTYQYLNKI